MYVELPSQELAWPLTVTLSSLKEITPELDRKGAAGLAQSLLFLLLRMELWKMQ